MNPRSRSTATLSALGILGALVLSGCSDGSEPTATAPVSSGPASSIPPSAPDSGGSATDGAIGLDEAGKIATDKYGGTVIGVESDHYQGKEAWEVEIRDSDQGRIEVKVEKTTGDILHMEHDD